MRQLWLATLVLLLGSMAADANDRQRLGYGRLTTNDTFGDTRDRWRTGGVQTSRVWGPGWNGTLPSGFGELIELRLGAQVVTPEYLVLPPPDDRPFAGILSAGLHTHFAHGALDISAGLDMVVTGPITQLDEIQSGLHDLLGVAPPSDAVLNAQIGDALHPTAVVEIGRVFTLEDGVRLRPFLEARAGLETFARLGFDLSTGTIGRDALMIRDSVTGHRYSAIRQPGEGLSFVFGADVAQVWDSALFPSTQQASLSDTRHRVRAGVHWQNDKGRAAFYGVTWLGPEFDQQRTGQVVGSLRYQFRF